MFKKVREGFNRIKQVCAPKIKRTMLMVSTAAMMFAACPMSAFAGIDISEDDVTTFLGSAVDVVFELMAAGVAVMGGFQLIPGIIHFVQASQAGNGDQRKEAGNGIVTAVVLLLLSGAIFMLKAPLKTMFGIS